MNLDIDSCQLFFVTLSLKFCSDKHLKPDCYNYIDAYIQKNVVLSICLFDILAFHSLREKQTE